MLKFGRWLVRYHGDSQFGQIEVQMEIGSEVKSWCVHQVTSVTAHEGMQMPQVGQCDVNDPFQKWAFTYRFDKLHDVPIL